MIKQRRNEKGYTQEDVARKMDISLRYYQMVENYQSIPTVIIAVKLCDFLGLSIRDVWSDYI